MKNLIRSVISALFILTVISCNSQQKAITKTQNARGDSSLTSVDWQGTYQGTLPCADCEGIKTQLVLNDDLSYILKTKYLGKSDSVFQEKGKFTWDNSGSNIQLENSGGQSYQVGENILFHLDKNGKRITGDLAEKYKLEKERTEITGKYWKLARLNGKQVKPGNREPFIRFNAENGVSGNSGCNNFNGKYEISEINKIKFSPFAMTKMACIDNNTEDEFMQAIGKTTGYSLTSDTLIFQDEFETTIAVFEADFFK